MALLAGFDDRNEFENILNDVLQKFEDRKNHIGSLFEEKYRNETGLAYIFSWQQYKTRNKQETSNDRENLKEVLKNIGYVVNMYNNLNKVELSGILSESK